MAAAFIGASHACGGQASTTSFGLYISSWLGDYDTTCGSGLSISEMYAMSRPSTSRARRALVPPLGAVGFQPDSSKTEKKVVLFKNDAAQLPSSENGESEDAATIQLGKFLKTQGVYETGGQTKTAIQNGEVLVNGQVEMRRGKRLRHGDTVEAAGLTIDVQFEVMQSDQDGEEIE